MRNLLIAVAVAVIAFLAGRSIAGEVRDRVFGPESAQTSAASIAVVPTATPTPPPPLPPNPGGLARWRDVPVHVCISSGDTGYVTPAQFIESVARAFDAWGIAWTSDGACGPIVAGDDKSEIGWGDLPTNDARRRSYEAGLTRTTTQECTANCDPNDSVRLSEADITIDRAPPAEFRNARCFYSTLLHEVGHFLGLGHLPPGTIMAEQTSGCPTELTQADRQALRDRYGARAP
jgi:hypothetical protein